MIDGQPHLIIVKNPKGMWLAGRVAKGMDKGCIACHTVRGTVAQGVIGPDLTHVGSRRRIAAGILDNTADNLERWIRNPQEVKPGALMVVPDLDDETVRRIVAYMRNLK